MFSETVVVNETVEIDAESVATMEVVQMPKRKEWKWFFYVILAGVVIFYIAKGGFRIANR